MIVDTSAVIAVLKAEPEAVAVAETMARANCRISAVSFVEAAAVVDRNPDPIAGRRLDDLLRTAPITIEPVSVEQARIARAAYRDFGKGSGHRARLNFGDCFAYALAKSAGEPLLFIGDDFRHTDITVAMDSRGESSTGAG
jgi:ribonuclease VapC